MDIGRRKIITVISLLLATALLFCAIFTESENEIGDTNPISTFIPPPYEEQFDDVSYYECNYILNKNTHKFHYRGCYTVEFMNQDNKVYCDDSRDSIIKHDYVPCKKCNP